MTFTSGEWTEARAAAILADHARGLHEQYERPDGTCGYAGCDASFWMHARAQEAAGEDDPWALW